MKLFFDPYLLHQNTVEDLKRQRRQFNKSLNFDVSSR